jgi:hypothetical protein
VAIKKYVPDIGFGPSKNKATFYVAEEGEKEREDAE